MEILQVRLRLERHQTQSVVDCWILFDGSREIYCSVHYDYPLFYFKSNDCCFS